MPLTLVLSIFLIIFVFIAYEFVPEQSAYIPEGVSVGSGRNIQLYSASAKHVTDETRTSQPTRLTPDIQALCFPKITGSEYLVTLSQNIISRVAELGSVLH